MSSDQFVEELPTQAVPPRSRAKRLVLQIEVRSRAPSREADPVQVAFNKRRLMIGFAVAVENCSAATLLGLPRIGSMLNAVHAARQAVLQGEILRMLGERRSEEASRGIQRAGSSKGSACLCGLLGSLDGFGLGGSVLTPHGHLALIEDRDAPALEPELAQRLQMPSRGDRGTVFCNSAPMSRSRASRCLLVLERIGAHYVTALSLCRRTEPRQQNADPSPRKRNWLGWRSPRLDDWGGVPDGNVLQSLWQELDSAFRLELLESQCGVQIS